MGYWQGLSGYGVRGWRGLFGARGGDGDGGKMVALRYEFVKH